jgi:DNA-binding NtrC family response regulator
VVDDEKQIVEIFAAFLAKMGFEVIQAFGGEEAIGLLKSGVTIDLMILDMKMPKVTGLDVLKVKNSLKDARPVIILTGSVGQEKIYHELKEFGFVREDIVYKPVDLFFLLGEVKKKLGMKT